MVRRPIWLSHHPAFLFGIFAAETMHASFIASAKQCGWHAGESKGACVWELQPQLGKISVGADAFALEKKVEVHLLAWSLLSRCIMPAFLPFLIARGKADALRKRLSRWGTNLLWHYLCGPDFACGWMAEEGG